MATITSLPHELLIYLRDRFGHEFYAHYAFVRINAAEMNYAIQLGEKVGGQLPDEWSDINQMAFAAFDHQGETQCNEMSGWWHTRGCRSVNLNIQMGSGTPRIRYANISKPNLCNIIKVITLGVYKVREENSVRTETKEKYTIFFSFQMKNTGDVVRRFFLIF